MEHVIGAVAVTEPEVQVLRMPGAVQQRDIGGTIVQACRTTGTGRAGALLIGRRILRVTHRPHFFALQRALRDDAVLLVGEVQVLRLAFLAEVHSVGAAAEHGAPAADELTLFVIHQDGIAALAIPVHRVVDVDQAAGVLNHAV